MPNNKKKSQDGNDARDQLQTFNIIVHHHVTRARPVIGLGPTN